MTDKKEKKAEKPEKKAEDEDSLKLKPCGTSHTMETSRPDKDEEACDEGVK